MEAPVRKDKKGMFLRWRKKNGQSVVEFTALIIFILAAFLVFQKYVVRSFSGRWKSVGDVIGQGRVFDPNTTTECAFDPEFTDTWFDAVCYRQNCEGSCLRASATPAACTACITGCHTPLCN